MSRAQGKYGEIRNRRRTEIDDSVAVLAVSHFSFAVTILLFGFGLFLVLLCVFLVVLCFSCCFVSFLLFCILRSQRPGVFYAVRAAGRGPARDS